MHSHDVKGMSETNQDVTPHNVVLHLFLAGYGLTTAFSTKRCFSDY